MRILAKHQASWVIIGLTALSGIIGLFFVDLDSKVPVHVNQNGKIDGFTTPVKAFLYLPIVQAVLTTLIASVIQLEKRKERLEQAELVGYFATIGCAIMFATLQADMLASTFGYTDVISFAPFSLNCILIVIGLHLKKLHPHHLIGIRTSATLSSKRVWHKTHGLCGRLLVVAATTNLIGSVIVSGTQLSLLMGGTILSALLFPAFHSRHFLRMERGNLLQGTE